MTTSTTDTSSPALRLSVVIASTNRGTLLAQCLDALVAQAPPTVQIIIVRDGSRFADVERGRHERVEWIHAPAGSTVPRLRGLGMAAARGPLIALLEDDCVVEPGWCRAALDLPTGAAATGGAVEPAPYQRALDWAMYFCEYGRFMLPVPTQEGALPGNNVVYAAWALARLPAAVRAEFHDVFVHEAWRGAGVPTQSTDALVVRNINTWSPRHVTGVPFHHGRAYAARRFGPMAFPMRATIAVLTVAMPMVKVLRIVRATTARRRWTGRLLVALPWMCVFMASWSAGEILGCLAGAGTSPSHWR